MRNCFTAVVSLILISTGVSLGESKNTPEPLNKNGSVAFLGITLLDTSLDGAHFGQEAENKRTELLQKMVIERFDREKFDLADISPIKSDLDAVANPAQCYGCELRLARKLNAAYVLVGEVHKVSNLILSISLVLKEVQSEKIVRARSVDIRANTDQSWQRGLNYLLDNYFFPENGN